MTAAPFKNKSPQAVWALPLAFCALTLFVTFLAFRASYDSVRQELQNYYDFRVREALARIDTRMQAYEAVLRGTAGLFEATGNVTRQEFQKYVTTLQLAEKFPGIQAVGFSLIVPPAAKQQHIAQIRSEGFPEYSIQPEGERALYTTILYIEPFSGRNLRAFGFDMYAEPIRHAAMQRALESNASALSAKVKLLQETSKQIQPGFLLYLPIYRHDKPHDSLAEKRENIIGWVYAPFRMYDFMYGLMGEQAGDLNIEIYDGKNISSESLMYDSDNKSDRYSSDSGHSESHRMQIFGHEWTIRIRPLESFKSRVDTSQPRIIAIIGILASVLLSTLIWSLVSSRERAIRTANSMNADLIAERYRLRGIIEGTHVGTWEWNVQTGETIFNQYWADIVGYALSELEPHSIETWNRLVHPDDAKLSAALLQKHFRGELEQYECEARMRHRNGHWVWVLDRGKVATWTPDGKPLMMFGTHQDVTQRKIAEQKIQYEAHHDALTGLPNRALLNDRLQQALLVAKREKKHLAVIFIDLDKFKPINDHFGHDTGDLLLQDVAQRIQDCLRESDTVARFGGDEFVVLLTAVEALQDALSVAEKIRDSLNQPFAIHGQKLQISSSSGVAISPEHGDEATRLVKHADIAMYYAKADGRDNVKTYQPSMHEISG